MRFFKPLSADDILRMPAGDRAPRLRVLIQRHRDALAALDPTAHGGGFQNRHIQHTRALEGLTELAKSLGLEGCLK